MKKQKTKAMDHVDTRQLENPTSKSRAGIEIPAVDIAARKAIKSQADVSTLKTANEARIHSISSDNCSIFNHLDVLDKKKPKKVNNKHKTHDLIIKEHEPKSVKSKKKTTKTKK